jgi:hypothetical protein
MKLKYIKLFEAFNSNILSKTIRYITNNVSRTNFLTNIKNICNSLEYPVSQLNDDLFEYLPFRKALEKSSNDGDEPCGVKSVDVFGSNGIKGETCKNGKIKRNWGSGTRNVTCSVCDGTGVKPKTSEIKLIKFWFNKDGISKGMTLVDGVIRRSNWMDPKSETEIDPYEWNVGFWLSRSYGNNFAIRIDPMDDVKNNIKDAHFAIILDFDKLKKSEFKKTGEIKINREESKLGSKLDPEQSDEKIKQKNIERYMNTLSKNLDISSNITNCDKLILRSLGYKNALFLIYSSNIESKVSSMIEYYLNILDESNTNKDWSISRLTNKADELFKHGLDKSNELIKSINEVKRQIKEYNTGEKREDYLKFIDDIIDLSSIIYNKIKSRHIECVEDFEVLNQLIISIKNILKSGRYPHSTRAFNYFVDYLYSYGPNRAYNYLLDDYYVDIYKASNDIIRIKKIIERM